MAFSRSDLRKKPLTTDPGRLIGAPVKSLACASCCPFWPKGVTAHKLLALSAVTTAVAVHSCRWNDNQQRATDYRISGPRRPVTSGRQPMGRRAGPSQNRRGGNHYAASTAGTEARPFATLSSASVATSNATTRQRDGFQSSGRPLKCNRRRRSSEPCQVTPGPLWPQ
jgi:hypothetical protein